MSIKTILVPLDGNEPVADVLATARVVAERFGSHISTLHISENSLQSVGYVANLSRALKESVIKEESRHLDDTADRVHEELVGYCKTQELTITDDPSNSNPVTVSWKHVYGNVGACLIEQARLHDVTALKRPVKSSSIIRRGQSLSATETILVKSGKPVLLVPPDWQARKCRHAVIAWNQSQESSRAVAMTIPWLEQMEKVSIVVAQSREASGENLVEYLSWHGISAELNILNRKTKSAGKRLLQVCEEIDGDFLVMGAFGAARIEQYLFGGVTDYVLNNSRIITVMVH